MNEQEYGYYTPTDAKVGDQSLVGGEWMDMIYMKAGETKSPFETRRRIEPGEGFEIVGLDDIPTPNMDGFLSCFVDGNWEDKWFNVITRCSKGIPVNKLVSENPEILAIRRPIQKQVGRENVPECSPEPSPRIYSRCPACGNDTLFINKGHLLCSWHECPDPTAIEWKGPKVQDKPQWIPISKCDLKPGEPFWYLCSNTVMGFLARGVQYPQQYFKDDIDGITHYCRAIGCYQIPPPPDKEEVNDPEQPTGFLAKYAHSLTLDKIDASYEYSKGFNHGLKLAEAVVEELNKDASRASLAKEGR